MKSKLIKIYQDKKGSFFIRATNNKFILKSDKFGKAISKNSSNETIGKTIREIFKNCD